MAIFDLNDDAGEAIARNLGEKAAYYHVDVAGEASVQQALDSVMERFGAVHVLNNFAGIGTPGKTLGKRGPLPLEQYVKVVEVNQIGAFNVARLAAEKMSLHAPVTGDGIRGLVHTPLFDSVEESFYNSLKASVVFPQRLGTPEEIAALCVSIVENDYINGETIRIDGAIRMQPR